MITITSTGAVTVVTFPYDEQAVTIIRTIPGRHWNAELKQWLIATDRARLAAKRFHDAGFTVTIDGRAYESTPPPSPTSATAKPPLVALFNVLPDRLRQPVYKALSKVLHPDVGGDTALMQQLNRAVEEKP